MEGKRKAFYDLGEDLYRKVYDLCDFHMKENVDEGEGNIKLVTVSTTLIDSLTLLSSVLFDRSWRL